MSSPRTIMATLTEVGSNAALNFLFAFFRRAWQSGQQLKIYQKLKNCHPTIYLKQVKTEMHVLSCWSTPLNHFEVYLLPQSFICFIIGIITRLVCGLDSSTSLHLFYVQLFSSTVNKIRRFYFIKIFEFFFISLIEKILAPYHFEIDRWHCSSCLKLVFNVVAFFVFYKLFTYYSSCGTQKKVDK